MKRDVAKIIRDRIGAEFDGECHLEEDEALEVANLIDAYEADAEAHTSRLERVRRLDDELRDSNAIASGLRAQLEAARQALDAISDGYGPNHLSAFCRNTADKARSALSKETGE